MEDLKKIHIIHGWTYTLNGWDACQALLREKGFEPVMLRVPGLTEPSEKVWTLPEYVAWLEEKLAGEKEVILVGHSNGGRIAIAALAKSPALIEKLILIDAAGIRHAEFQLRFRQFVLGSIARLGKKLTQSPRARKIYYRIIGARDYGNAPENMRETMKNLIAIDLTEQLSEIKIPTLIIWGKQDTVTPLSDAHLMHKSIVNSKLVVIDRAHHSPHMSDPIRVVEEIKNWLQN